ncbi:DUF4232 domain-containing protein [Streptomyces sp. TLI_171]|uniref:DUF4232 domain-containing protein n=1 Tax=Streptomyces sp. TLI_171 TaxID=1938859 RepID=UPI000C17B7F6|nr:DUF4232 domain-containing protein [Streptomyces sp. TLI_171]RKE23025.1 uncharacterized protein DUF4232 [Streptomyces sp. TLI_171]
MRNRHLAATAALVAALGLTLTACDDDTAAPAATTAAAAPAASGTGAPPAAPSTSATGSSTGGNSGSGSNSGSRKCTAADLKAAVTHGAQSTDAQGVEEIELTNRGSATCTMKGYPGLDLVSGTQTWNLPRYQPAQADTVTLKPGGKAYVAIDYLPYMNDGTDEFKVSKIVLTPPDDTTQLTVSWVGANPMDQSGATHPGTYVRPVSASH